MNFLQLLALKLLPLICGILGTEILDFLLLFQLRLTMLIKEIVIIGWIQSHLLGLSEHKV